MIEVKNVSKIYKSRKKETLVLHDINLIINNGDFVSIIGSSGSGKSTLLLLIGGMLSPSDGSVLIDGESIYDKSPNERANIRRKKIGFVFQTFNLIPYLSALDNVQIPLCLSQADDIKQKARATALLERLGLSDRMDHKPSELSVGQQQRVALARMLANDPDIVLADEPTGNLDPEIGNQILDFLEEINKEGKTVVMVTHDMRAAARCRKTMKLEGGTIHTIGGAL
jgi:putative ABC transport system ATP-binding protein